MKKNIRSYDNPLSVTSFKIIPSDEKKFTTHVIMEGKQKYFLGT